MSGPLVLLGSGEFEPWTNAFEAALLRDLPPGPVVIVPTASAPDGDEVFRRWGRKGVGHFAALGREAEVADVRRREDASDPAAIEAVDRASLVYLSGGNPAYLASTLAASPFWNRVTERHAAGMALVGCSAGACVLGGRAFDPSRSRRDPGFWTEGLGLLPRTLIIPHWDTMDRFRPGARAWFAGQVPSGWSLLAIDEETALLPEDGRAWRVEGRGTAELRHPTGATHEARAGSTLPPI